MSKLPDGTKIPMIKAVRDMAYGVCDGDMIRFAEAYHQAKAIDPTFSAFNLSTKECGLKEAKDFVEAMYQRYDAQVFSAICADYTLSKSRGVVYTSFKALMTGILDNARENLKAPEEHTRRYAITTPDGDFSLLMELVKDYN